MKRIMDKKATSSYSGVQGHALLELIIVLPLLWAVLLAGIEFGRALNTYQEALALSQEIASTSYRECIVDVGEYDNSAFKEGGKHNPLFDPSTCLATVRDSFAASVRTLEPRAEFFVSMYRYSSGNIFQDGVTALQGNPAVYSSKLTTSSFSGGSDPGAQDMADALKNYEVLVAAEVYFPHDTIFSSFLDIFFFDPGAIYAATLL